MAIPSWLYLSETAGTSGITTITVSAGTNTLSEINIKRLEVVTNTTDMSKEVAILQEASGDTGDTEDFEKEYLTIEALEDGDISFTNRTDTSFFAPVEYSLNGSQWAQYNGAIFVNKGDKVRWRGTNKTYSSSSSGGKWFTHSMSVKAYGNIMSLTEGDNFATAKTLYSAYTFHCLFSGRILDVENLVLPATTLANHCYDSMFSTTLITKPPKVLPATTLESSCYSGMFYGCPNLESTPLLPATILAPYCYYNMFDGCTSLLTTIDNLPATSLTEHCYRGMFALCRYLRKAPALPATTLANYCYAEMFAGCSHLEECPDLPATILNDACYYRMFEGCVSLTKSPDLLAENLPNDCYVYMFYDCNNLNYVKCMAKDIYYGRTPREGWLHNVSSSGTFVKRGSTTWPSGDSGIPNGWTIINN